MKASWRTTLMGILTLVGVVALQLKNVFDGDPTTGFDFEAIVAALAGVGLLFARDNKVTSEEAGAKK